MTSHLTSRGILPLSYTEWPEAEGQPEAVTVPRILSILRRRRWGLACAAVLGLCGSIFFLASSEPRYVANGQLIISPQGPHVIEKDVTPSAENADAQVAMVENEMRVLKSSQVFDALIARDHLDADPEFVGDPPGLLRRIKSAIASAFKVQIAPRGDPRVMMLQALDRKIAVRRTERSFVVDVTVTTRDPVKSAKIANDLVAIYTEEAIKARSDLARRAGTSLDNRLKELRGAMREAEDRVESFKSKHDLVSANGLLTRDQRLRDLNAQLAAARARSNEMHARMEQAASLRGSLDAMPEAVQSQAITQLRGQIAEARRRQANLANNLGPRHPELLAAGKEVADLQSLLDQELKRIGEAARNEYRRAKQTEEGLQKVVDSLSRSSLTDSRALSDLRELEREADARRTLFAQYLVRSRELTEQTRVDLSNVRSIGSAVPPEAPTNPSKLFVLAAGALIGLFCGMIAAIAFDVLRADAGHAIEPRDASKAVEAKSHAGALRDFG